MQQFHTDFTVAASVIEFSNLLNVETDSLLEPSCFYFCLRQVIQSTQGSFSYI